MRNIFSFLLILSLSFSIAQTTDANGKKQGHWIKKDPSGQHVIYEGTFKDNKPVGKFKYFHPNDTIRAIMDFKQEGKVAYARLFHMSTGKLMGLGKYIQEIKDSVWTYYDESGSLLSKDSYTMGKKNGTCYVYLRNGQVAEERNYKMDQQHGPFKLYIDGKKLRGQGNYVNGQLDGKATYYYPNGVEVAAGFYKNGQKTGPWIYKEESGKIKEKEWYVDGKLASAKESEALFAKNKTTEKTATNTTTTNGIYNLKKDKKSK
jgi:antitoxin component YwqK of YwqJK toxin-antitoxin module